MGGGSPGVVVVGFFSPAIEGAGLLFINLSVSSLIEEQNGI